jgi:hypothetical protein
VIRSAMRSSLWCLKDLAQLLLDVESWRGLDISGAD